MDVLIKPQKLMGKIAAISSKSDGHRAIICATLCKEQTVIELNCFSKDIEATVNCIKALGAKVCVEKNKITVQGGIFKNEAVLNCFESGSTARFLLPVAAAVLNKAEITGEGRLPQRPFIEICDVLRSHGCEVSNNNLPIPISGKLTGGTFEIAGNVSSQYISGLLFALPLLKENSEIVLTTPLQSRHYVDMTINTLNTFGIKIQKTTNGFKIMENQEYKSPILYKVEGDWSNGAFFIGANALGSSVLLEGLNSNSLQGDKAIEEIAKNIKDIKTVNVGEIPDLVPIIAIMFALNKGRRFIENASRLRIKESDRIKSVCNMVNSLGGKAIEHSDSIEIIGGSLKGGLVESFNDHRIVMAAAIGATACEGEVIIKNAQAVEKSYPRFFEDFSSLGGLANVL